MKNKAVFLDRDGVLNRAIVKEGKPYPPCSLQELEIPAGTIESVIALKDAGYILIVVSNQPDVKRKTVSKSVVEEINHYLAERMPIDRFIMCYHDSEDNCDCRKPKPGMLLTGAFEFDIDLTQSFMVGDRWRDIEAGKNAGCKTIYIDYGYNEEKPKSFDYKVCSLREASGIILSGVNK